MNKVIIYVICLVVIVLQLVAIITHEWSIKIESHDDIGSASEKMGLWKVCYQIDTISTKEQGCYHIPNEKNPNFPKYSLNLCRVFAILGVICVVAVLSMFYKTQKKLQLEMLIIGSLCSLVCMIVWAVNLFKYKDGNGNEMKLNPGYSFYLNAIGGVLALVAAGYFYWTNGSI